MDDEFLEDIMPWAKNLPDIVKIKKNK